MTLVNVFPFLTGMIIDGRIENVIEDCLFLVILCHACLR